MVLVPVVQSIYAVRILFQGWSHAAVHQHCFRSTAHPKRRYGGIPQCGSSELLVPSSFLLLLVRPGAASSFLFLNEVQHDSHDSPDFFLLEFCTFICISLFPLLSPFLLL